MKKNYIKLLRNLTLLASVAFMSFNVSAQTVVYDIPLGQLVGHTTDCGGGNWWSNSTDWGIGWTSTGASTPTSINVQMYQGVGCTGTTDNVSLNGNIEGTIIDNNQCTCTPATFSTHNLNMTPANYNVGGYNEVLVTRSGNAGLSANGAWGGAYARVTVVYPIGGTTAITGNYTGGGIVCSAGPYEIGNEFTVGSSDIYVTSLGAYDCNGDGLAAATPVTIWNTTTTSAVATATVPAGTASTLEGDFRYVSISPITLTAGNTYRMSAFGSEGYAYSTANGVTTSASEISIVGGYYNNATAAYPNTVLSNDFVGANFKFSNAGNAAFLTYDEQTNSAGTWEIGNIFTVGSQNITVTNLGAYDRFSDGLSGTTSVTIWNNGGGIVAQANVPSGTTAPLINEMRYVSISPVVLTAGNTYRITSYGSEGYSYSNGPASGTEAAEISVLYGCYNNSGSPGYPSTNLTGNDFYGANFLFYNACEAYSYENLTACNSATINGTTYTSSQTVVDVFTNGANSGCDSTHTTYLTIGNAVNSSENMTACNSATINGTTYTSSQTVVDVFTGGSSLGCDSTHTTYLTIGSAVNSSENMTACNSATINGTTYTSSQTVVDVFTGGSSFGCDSTHTTNLTITNTAVNSSENMTACSSATINGNTYTTSQTVVDNFAGGAVGGCDSIHTTNLTITGAPANDSCNAATAITAGTYFGSTLCATNDNEVTCGTSNGTLGGVWYSYTSNGGGINANTCGSGTDFDTKIRVFEGACGALTCVAGNDDACTANRSIVNWCGVSGTTYYILVHGWSSSEGNFEFNISETAIPVSNNNLTACGTVTINGNSYSSSQVVTDTLSGASLTGCDSIAITNFTLSTFALANLSQTNCDSVMIFGNMYYNSQMVYDTVANGSINNCDSITAINLTINNSSTDSISYATCNSSYFVGGGTQTSNGVYTDNFTGMNGCDSVVVTTLTLNASGTTYLVDEEICQGGSITVDTNTYTTSGTYYDTIVMGACDSIIITTLTVNSNVTTSLTETINFGESFTVGGTAYNTSGTHVTTLNAASGCDSIVTLNLTVLVGIAAQYTNNITLYPNPTSGLLNLEIADYEGDELELVRIVDLNGKEMATFTNVNLNNNNSQIDISELSDGVYIVESTFESGSKSIVKVVKMN